MLWVVLGLGLGLGSALGLGSGFTLGLELVLMSASSSTFYTFNICIHTSAFYPWPDFMPKQQMENDIKWKSIDKLPADESLVRICQVCLTANAELVPTVKLM